MNEKVDWMAIVVMLVEMFKIEEYFIQFEGWGSSSPTCKTNKEKMSLYFTYRRECVEDSSYFSLLHLTIDYIIQQFASDEEKMEAVMKGWISHYNYAQLYRVKRWIQWIINKPSLTSTDTAKLNYIILNMSHKKSVDCLSD